MGTRVRVSVVIPMFNEQEALPLLERRLRPVLDGLHVWYEVVAVDDGSTDHTFATLQAMAREWPQLRLIGLRRNSGHQPALTAGILSAYGDYVISIDADLQDPPETIPEMIALAEQDGLDVVYGVRTDRRRDSIGKRTTARLYYRLMRRLVGRRMPLDGGDFRLISRSTVEVLRHLPERQPVFRMILPWIGFRSGEVGYVREKRAAGRTKYPLSKMVKLATDSVASFSAAPLRLAIWLGLIGFAFAGLIFAASIVGYVLGYAIPGWTSIFGAVVVLGAVQLLCLGLMGEYVARIYSLVQGRPAYFIGYDSAMSEGRTEAAGTVPRYPADPMVPQRQQPVPGPFAVPVGEPRHGESSAEPFDRQWP